MSTAARPSSHEPDSTTLQLTRTLLAPRANVFQAWARAEHVRRWFAPGDYTVPYAEVQLRRGGPFVVCMRSPLGEEHWIRGEFLEIVPQAKLVLDMTISDGTERVLLKAKTTVVFSDVPEGTRLDLTQAYTLLDPSKGGMIQGAPAGWRSTLDKLEAEGQRVGQMAGERSVAHGVFHLERTYDVPVARVWKALTDPVAKAKWFAGPPGRWELIERHMDVRVHGDERLTGRWQGGVVTTFDAHYHDVVLHQRLVYSYAMYMDERKLSVSLATVELNEVDSAPVQRTTFKITEQGAFLDGYEDAGAREQGTADLLEALGRSLRD